MLQQKGTDAKLLGRSVLEHMPLRRLQGCVDIIFDSLAIAIVHPNSMRFERRVALDVVLHASPLRRELEL